MNPWFNIFTFEDAVASQSSSVVKELYSFYFLNPLRIIYTQIITVFSLYKLLLLLLLLSGTWTKTISRTLTFVEENWILGFGIR